MFFLLIPLALALLVASMLGLAGLGPLTDERRADRSGVLGGIGPVIGLVLGAGLLVIAVVATVGIAGLSSGDDPSNGDDTDAGGEPTMITRAPITRTPTTRASVPVAGPAVMLEAESGDDGTSTFPTSYEAADGLAPDTVLSVRVRGFETFASGIAEQCSGVPSLRCANAIPVQFDGDGIARFQYLITDDFLESGSNAEGCRLVTAPCTIEVRSRDETGRETRASVQTVFGDTLPESGRIVVTPSSGLSLDGEPVTVDVRDYPPGVAVTAMLCAAPDAFGPRCGAPGPSAVIDVGADGTGRTTLVVSPGPVGDDRVSCARGDDCGISVASDDVFVRAPVVPISFAPPPGAAYDPLRLALGLALAVVLLLGAAVLLVRTDWAPVGEAAAPEIDDAEYADLDAIIAALPPEDADELAPVP